MLGIIRTVDNGVDADGKCVVGVLAGGVHERCVNLFRSTDLAK